LHVTVMALIALPAYEEQNRNRNEGKNAPTTTARGCHHVDMS